MEILFPIEFLVYGNPVSQQAKRAEARTEWKIRVIDATVEHLPENHFASELPISVSIFFFPEELSLGDLDNLAKPILDAFSKHIYIDDDQVHRLWLQKFEPHRVYSFTKPTPTLTSALKSERSVIYVRIAADPHEDYE